MLNASRIKLELLGVAFMEVTGKDSTGTGLVGQVKGVLPKEAAN